MTESDSLCLPAPAAAVTVRRPSCLSPRLFFHVYKGPVAVGYAHLSSRAAAIGDAADSAAPAAKQKSPGAGGVSYCLKAIEVNQNYRNRGIGSTLLAEVIDFCREQRVQSLHGEAKGDRQLLRRWYADRGFEVDTADAISLSFDRA